jgi:hypothetical protein
MAWLDRASGNAHGLFFYKKSTKIQWRFFLDFLLCRVFGVFLSEGAFKIASKNFLQKID